MFFAFCFCTHGASLRCSSLAGWRGIWTCGNLLLRGAFLVEFCRLTRTRLPCSFTNLPGRPGCALPSTTSRSPSVASLTCATTIWTQRSSGQQSRQHLPIATTAEDGVWQVWGKHHRLSRQDLLHDITRHAFGDSGQRRSHTAAAACFFWKPRYAAARSLWILLLSVRSGAIKTTSSRSPTAGRASRPRTATLPPPSTQATQAITTAAGTSRQRSTTRPLRTQASSTRTAHRQGRTTWL